MISIDSGTSDHAVNDLSLFRTIDTVDNVTLELADRFSAGAVAIRTVLLEV